ncbi:hypothetical protein GLOIN_2v1847651 [Rhizophagus irregularis DAOM 181602=DAOM 197198]|uniref:CBM20 domain-containing protein n=3 Tax=Rhizophagus irregularis TaxID=588596 RepID=A0A015JFX4_RHIIW|nr:hypothetical protein RirG_127850 [Rhizophagus irregularis DAOM 197198w]GBC14825.2 hypothetical protein GLOIN_2v1847651 [Rhizophagus irregularis DAOM 181602=DAOM 197198]
MENNKFIFNVHLPENIEKIEQPVVVGGVVELGMWRTPIVKLRQPYPHDPTYWQSDPVTINIVDKRNIYYKYAIYVPKSSLKKEVIIYEGTSDLDNRTLDFNRSSQFAIWKINRFSFVDYIYDSLNSDNLKDKILEYQHLLTLYNNFTIIASRRHFILRHSDDQLKEKRQFLCLLLGYDIQRTNDVLDNKFPSGSLLNAFEDHKKEALPLDTEDQMYAAIMILVHHNAFQLKFDWLIIFIIANEIDPNYTFIDRLKSLKYSDENLAKFVEKCKTIKPYNENIKFESYIKITKWLIQLCHNMDSLLKLWNDVLFHNNEIDRTIFKHFIDQIRKCVSHDDAVALEYHFKRLPGDFRYDVSEVFRSHTLFLLEGSNRKWTNENITAIVNLLNNDSLHWSKDEVIQLLELISQSHTLEILNLFPEILNDCFRSDLTDTKEKKISECCLVWFKNFIDKLNSSNESDLIFLMFQRLELVHPFLSQRINVWQNLSDIVIERTKKCQENQIFDAIKLVVVQIKQNDVKKLFLDTVKEILNKHYPKND